MQQTTNIVTDRSARRGVDNNIHRGKRKILKVNSFNKTPVKLGDEVIEETEERLKIRSSFLKNKIGIFNMNVKSAIIYGAETRRTTATQIQTFVNSCRRRIMGVR